MSDNEATRAVGIFELQSEAVAAVRALWAAGYEPERIAVVARTWEGAAEALPRVDLQHSASEGAVIGTVGGSALGAAAGIVAACLLPGLGHIAAATLLLSAIGGAAAGASAGVFIGPFIAMEMTEEEAHEHGQHVEQGRTVVVVRTDRAHQEEVRTILVIHGAYDYSMSTEP